MPELTCPEEDKLLALATGGPGDPDVVSHVELCPACERRVAQLRSEIGGLRGIFVDETSGDLASSFAPTTPWNAVGHRGSDEATAGDVPASIGKYRVIGKIAQGGQADVYRVVHPTLPLDLVLKLSRKEMGAAAADRDRLVAEGKVLAELDHACLARIIDLDFHDNRAFLVMEYVRGRNLRQHLRHQRPSPQQAAGLLLQAGRALAVAHARGIIHQDVKPENIVIDENGQPRVIDFGLAVLRHAWVDDPGDPGTITGSVPYMAPEQARGEKDRIDAPTDVFALGAVLYEMLVGHPPFTGRDDEEILARAQRCDFDRGALKSAGVPGELEGICLTAMEAEPDQRYPNAAAFADALEKYAPPASPTAARPERPRLAVAGAILVLALIVVGVFTWINLPSRYEPGLQNLVQLQRNGRVFQAERFAQALPTKTGDQLRIHCEVPLDMQAVVFHLDSQGFFKLAAAEEVTIRSGEESATVVYPNKGTVPLDEQVGTELFLVCAAPEIGSLRDKLRTLLEEFFQRQPLPAGIPNTVMVVMNHNQVEVRSEVTPRGGDDPQWNALSELEDRLEELRGRLRETLPFFAGVAFPHVKQARR